MLLLGYELEKQNPGCRFVYSEYPGAEAYKTVNLRAQEGDPVDIYSGGGSSIAQDGGAEWKAGMLVDLTKAMESPAFGQSTGRWLDSFNAAAPVSYTHLDVYKRQAMVCTMMRMKAIIP